MGEEHGGGEYVNDTYLNLIFRFKVSVLELWVPPTCSSLHLPPPIRGWHHRRELSISGKRRYQDVVPEVVWVFQAEGMENDDMEVMVEFVLPHSRQSSLAGDKWI